MHLPNYIQSFNILTFLIVSLPLFFFLTLVFNSFPTALCECKEIQAKKETQKTHRKISLFNIIFSCHYTEAHSLHTSFLLSYHWNTCLTNQPFLDVALQHIASVQVFPCQTLEHILAHKPFLVMALEHILCIQALPCHGTRARPFCTRLSLSDTAAHPCIQVLSCHDTVAHPLLSSLYCHALVNITYMSSCVDPFPAFHNLFQVFLYKNFLKF